MYRATTAIATPTEVANRPVAKRWGVPVAAKNLLPHPFRADGLPKRAAE
jgi:hypothetical protein